jgi:TolB-like protein
MSEEPLLQRILQRKMLPWTLAYLAGAFLLYQGIEILDESFGLSPLLYHASHVLLVLGFLLTVVLAWHHGPPGTQRVTGKELMLLAAVLAAGGTALALLRRVEEEVALPPGFTITPAGEAGGQGEAGPGRSPGGAREALGDLIAATFPGEGDQFEASLAILPLENRTGLPALDTLASGMTDELITRLSRIRGLKVISRQSVQELEGLNLTPDEVADTLDVDHLLMGTALSTAEGASVEVRLVQIPEDDTLWLNEYGLGQANRELVLEEITNQVGAALLVDVPALSLGGDFRSTESPGYVAYLAGSQLLNTRTRDGVMRAIETFRTAIGLDTQFALAYAGLSSAYALSVTYRYQIGVDAYAAAGLALRAADAAVELDPELAEAYAARGYISSVSLAPAQIVGSDFARAMEIQPNAPNVAAWYANLLIREGYYDQALAEAQRAVQLDPLSSPRRTGLAYEALRARDYGLAIEQARIAQTLESEVMLPRSIHAQALLLSGRAEECLQMDLGPYEGIRAMCLHDVGRQEEAQAIVDSLRAVVRSGRGLHPEFTGVIPAGDLASYFAWTGDPERALPWIHRAYALSPSGIDPRVLESGLFDELLENRDFGREVEDIRSRIWARVQREEAEAIIGLGGRDG